MLHMIVYLRIAAYIIFKRSKKLYVMINNTLVRVTYIFCAGTKY